KVTFNLQMVIPSRFHCPIEARRPPAPSGQPFPRKTPILSGLVARQICCVQRFMSSAHTAVCTNRDQKESPVCNKGGYDYSLQRSSTASILNALSPHSFGPPYAVALLCLLVGVRYAHHDSGRHSECGSPCGRAVELGHAGSSAGLPKPIKRPVLVRGRREQCSGHRDDAGGIHRDRKYGIESGIRLLFRRSARHMDETHGAHWTTRRPYARIPRFRRGAGNCP